MGALVGAWRRFETSMSGPVFCIEPGVTVRWTVSEVLRGTTTFAALADSSQEPGALDLVLFCTGRSTLPTSSPDETYVGEDGMRRPALGRIVRCHTPNRFGTVNMEDNVNIKRS